MSTVREIPTEMDGLTQDESRVVKLGVDSRLSDDDEDPALLVALGPKGGHKWPYWHHQMWEYVGAHF